MKKRVNLRGKVKRNRMVGPSGIEPETPTVSR